MMSEEMHLLCLLILAFLAGCLCAAYTVLATCLCFSKPLKNGVPGDRYDAPTSL